MSVGFLQRLLVVLSVCIRLSTNSVQLPKGCWESTLIPLKEQLVLSHLWAQASVSFTF